MHSLEAISEMLFTKYSVSHETISKFRAYQELLIKWNSKINLVSSSTLAEFWSRHILDSIQLLQYIENYSLTIADLGSGAGFPSIVLSIAGIKNTIIIESDSRKVAFLSQAAKLSDNNIELINDRVENLNISCDLITSRAFASLSKTLKYTNNFKVKDRYLLLKGNTVLSEIEQALLYKKFSYKIHNSVTNLNSWILEVKI